MSTGETEDLHKSKPSKEQHPELLYSTEALSKQKLQSVKTVSLKNRPWPIAHQHRREKRAQKQTLSVQRSCAL